jgi:hypothetical protein
VSRYDGPASGWERGEAVYRAKGCVLCHGESGEGGIGPALRQSAVSQPKEIVFQRMWNHAPRMQDKMGTRQIPWPRFEADELASLLALLERGWGGPAAATIPRK